MGLYEFHQISVLVQFVDNNISYLHSYILLCNYCNWGHLDKVVLLETNNTFQETWLRANQQAVKKNKLLNAQNSNRRQNITLDNVFVFETLCIIPRKDVCLTQAVILSSTSNFFATIATHCNNMQPLKSKYN